MNIDTGKLYQDQIYGAKILGPIAIAIIDTPEFQRLAGLRQLGFADVTYRAARHTRFEHSVGTYFISRTIMRRIVQNHERLGLPHPGIQLSPAFRIEEVDTAQARWLGMTEVVSTAALLHDLGHVPFGHTLEDEFSGLYKRHDSLGGPRLHEMLFNKTSDLSNVFSNDIERWLPELPNDTYRRLVYTILNWKESIKPPYGFQDVLSSEIEKAEGAAKDRLNRLSEWHAVFVQEELFHPFMSDIVGNTICSDILDYLARDRMNLGMEPHTQSRLHRYFTIREGSLYKNEGYRMSIMVTRAGRGGQRPDVATAVLDVMRQRYQMAERVFYHHKKAAASAMLAKLVELAGEKAKPRDDERIYPAPWQKDRARIGTPHMTHLSDSGLIDYLGNLSLDVANRTLQKQLYDGLRFRRKDMYRTLLVIDLDLIDASRYGLDYVLDELRGPGPKPTAEGRWKLERELEKAADASAGEIIVYCPSAKMQSKEVDARLEIKQNSILPLRVQRGLFVYTEDVEVLQHYYKELWRAYLFVSPSLYQDAAKCRAVVDGFCRHYGITPAMAYGKVRRHDFMLGHGVTTKEVMAAIGTFLNDVPFSVVPPATFARLLGAAAADEEFLLRVKAKQDIRETLQKLLVTTELRAKLIDGTQQFSKAQKRQVAAYCDELLAGTEPIPIQALAARSAKGIEPWPDFDSWINDELLKSILTAEDAEGGKHA